MRRPDAGHVDVVIPVRNGARYIAEAVQSALSQTLPPGRVIIVDDGSTDATTDILAGIDDERLDLISTSPRGVSHARNAGIALSAAPFIAFLDADDVWEPDKLERQMDVFSANPSAGVVHCGYSLIDADGSSIEDGVVVPPQRRGNLFEPLLFDQYVLSGSSSSVIVRRKCLEVIGRFDEALFDGEDWDLWIRLARRYDYDYAPEPLVRIRVHAESAQRRSDPVRRREILFQHVRIYEKWARSVRFPVRVKHRHRLACCRHLRSMQVSLGNAKALHARLVSEAPDFTQALFASRPRFLALMFVYHAAWLVLRYPYIFSRAYLRKKLHPVLGRGQKLRHEPADGRSARSADRTGGTG